MTLSEQLDAAADLIEERGWIKGPAGWGYHRDGGLCIEGAILGVLNTTWSARGEETLLSCPMYKAVADFVNLDEGMRLYTWNDYHAISQNHVVAVLRTTAALERLAERAGEKVPA